VLQKTLVAVGSITDGDVKGNVKYDHPKDYPSLLCLIPDKVSNLVLAGLSNMVRGILITNNTRQKTPDGFLPT
jgi:hypothetical protein